MIQVGSERLRARAWHFPAAEALMHDHCITLDSVCVQQPANRPVCNVNELCNQETDKDSLLCPFSNPGNKSCGRCNASLGSCKCPARTACSINRVYFDLKSMQQCPWGLAQMAWGVLLPKACVQQQVTSPTKHLSGYRMLTPDAKLQQL